jgi:hypothetical protein
MVALRQIFGDLHTMLLHFRIIWAILTVAASIGVARAVGRAPVPADSSQRQKHPFFPWQQFGRPSEIVAIVLLAVFLASYIVMSLVWDDFVGHDGAIFTVFLRGRNAGMPIVLSQGRFWPLGLQEFDVIRHFTDTMLGYQVVPMIQLLVFVCLLMVVLDDLGIPAGAALVIFALLTPSVLVSLTGLIFPERNVLFFLVCLVLCVMRFEQTQSVAWAVAAVVCAQFMLYYKETAFLLLLGFASGRLILRCRGARNAGWDYSRLLDRYGRLDLGLGILALLFVAYYFAIMGLHPSTRYGSSWSTPLGVNMLNFIRVDLLTWLLTAVVLCRSYLILRRRTTALPLWDGLALGGVACFVAYIVLRLFALWYMAPVDLIAVLYLGRFVILSFRKISFWRASVVATLVGLILVQNVFCSALYIFEWKNGMHANVAIARLIEAKYRNGGKNSLTLFFPFGDPYWIMILASYQSYHGVPVEGADVGSGKVVLATPAMAKSGPCFPGEAPCWCRAVSRPRSGDLVVLLPNETVPPRGASVYRAGGQLLLSYEPWPRWFHSLVGSLHIISPLEPPMKLTDRWLNAWVVLWR